MKSSVRMCIMIIIAVGTARGISLEEPVEVVELGSENSLDAGVVEETASVIEPDSLPAPAEEIGTWENPQHLATLRGHSNDIRALDFSSDGMYLASGGDDAVAKIWSMTSMEEVQSIESERDIQDLEFFNNELTLVIVAFMNVYVVNPISGEVIWSWPNFGQALLSLGNAPTFTNAVLNSDDSMLFLGGMTIRTRGSCGHIITFNAHDGSDKDELYSGVEYSETVMAMHPSTPEMAVCNLKHVTIMSAFEAGCHRRIGVHDDDVKSVVYSIDGRYLVTGSADDTVCLWDAESGELIRQFEGHDHNVHGVDISVDNRYIASGSKDMTVRIWRVEDGECVAVLRDHTDDVNAVRFSPDGSYLATAGHDDTVIIWSRGV